MWIVSSLKIYLLRACSIKGPQIVPVVWTCATSASSADEGRIDPTVCEPIRNEDDRGTNRWPL